MLYPRSIAVFLIALAAAPAFTPAAESAAKKGPISVADVQRTEPVDFEKEILPVFSTSCLACHNKTKAKAGLILETPADIAKGGEDGAVVVPGKSAESKLLKASTHAVGFDNPMPPPNNKVAAPDLTPQQLGLVKLWIDQGAKGEVRGLSAPIAWQAIPATLDPIYAVALTPDGRYAACGRANRIDIYDLPAGKLAAHLIDPQVSAAGPSAAHRDMVESLAFSPDAATLASGSFREVKLWKRSAGIEKLALGDKPATAIAVSPDGSLIAIGAEDGIVRLSDGTGKSAGELSGHSGAVVSLRFSPDGKQLLSGSKDKSVRVWDIAAKKAYCQADAPAEVRAVAWAAAGKVAVAGCADGSINSWKLPKEAGGDMTAGAKPVKDSKSPIVAMETFPTDDGHVAVASEDGAFRRINVESGSSKPVLPKTSAIAAFAFRPDGKELATVGADNIVRLVNPADGKLIAELKGDPALAAQASAADRAVALAKNEITYRKGRIDLAEKQAKASGERAKKATDALPIAEKALADAQKAHDAAKSAREAAGPATTQESKPDTAKSAAAGKDDKKDDKKPEPDKGAAAKEQKLATLDTDLKKAEEDLKKAQGTKAAIEDEIKLSAKGIEDSEAIVNKAKDANKAAEDQLKACQTRAADARKAAADSLKPVRAVAFSPDGASIATAGEDGVVRLWGADKGSAGAAFSDNGPLAAAAFAGGRIIACPKNAPPAALSGSISWKLDRTIGNPDSTAPFADRVTSIDFSPDGKLLATGGGVPSRSGEIRLFDSSTGDLKKALDDIDSDTVLCLRFNPDGTRLATASTDRFVRITDLQTGKVVLSLEGHTGHALSVAWSHDGHTLASGGADNNLRFWDAETGDRGKVVAGFDKEVTSVTFVSDDNQCVATSGEGKVRLVRDSGADVRSYPGPTDFVFNVAASADGATIVAGGQDGILRVWDTAGAQPPVTFGAVEKK